MPENNNTHTNPSEESLKELEEQKALARGRATLNLDTREALKHKTEIERKSKQLNARLKQYSLFSSKQALMLELNTLLKSYKDLYENLINQLCTTAGHCLITSNIKLSELSDDLTRVKGDLQTKSTETTKLKEALSLKDKEILELSKANEALAQKLKENQLKVQTYTSSRAEGALQTRTASSIGNGDCGYGSVRSISPQ